MKIKHKYDNDFKSVPDFFIDHVLYPVDGWGYKQRVGVEGQAEKLAQLYGALIETLLIRNTINVDDVNRILGSYYSGVEIEDNND